VSVERHVIDSVLKGLLVMRLMVVRIEFSSAKNPCNF
jgi:hypothetical protein